MKSRNYVSKYLHQFNKASVIHDKRQSKQRVCWEKEARKEIDGVDDKRVDYEHTFNEQEEN